MSNHGGLITSESRKTLKPRGKGKKTLMVEAVEAAVEGGTHEYLRKLAQVTYDKMDSDPNAPLVSMVVNRISPAPRMEKVVIEFEETDKPHERADKAIAAAMRGEISIDIVKHFVDTIGIRLKVEEVTALKARIEELESMAGK